MTIESLQALATLTLLLSAANERFIEAIKNLAAPWLAPASPATPNGPVDATKDRRRQVVVQLLSIASALLVASWIAAAPGETFGSHLVVGTGPDARRIHVLLLALLTSGGAAFWNGILDFTRAAAKLRAGKAETMRRLNAGELAVVSDGGGERALLRGAPPASAAVIHIDV